MSVLGHIRGKMMTSSTGIHCPDVAFFAPRGVVSRKLVLFSKKRGLCNGVSTLFVGHLVSRRHSAHKFPHVIGEELVTPQVSKDVLHCPESLHKDHGGTLGGVIENFPHLPDTETEVLPRPATRRRGKHYDALRLKTMSRVSSGCLPLHFIYLLEIGFTLDQIKAITWKDPYFAHHSLEKIRPLIKFLLDLRVSKSDLPSILFKYPSLCGLSLSENLIPVMAFIETLGLDKTKWAKLITRFPYIMDQSVEDQLRPTAEYLQSLGVDVTVVLQHSPEVMGLSIEANLKPFTEFFLENGFSIEEVGTMISKYGYLCSRSLKAILIPKWQFFLTMGYQRQDLVKFPQYFTYSVEDRIKPRYNLMKECGVKLPLSTLLNLDDHYFELLLKKKIEKLQLDVAVQLDRCPQTMSNSMDAKRKLITEFFLENGFSREEVGTMISKFPRLCNFSLKRNLIPKWELFLTMGYPRQDLVKFPHYFCFSIEDRIKPRYNLMKECGVKLPLSTLLNRNNYHFRLFLKKIKKLQVDKSCN